jgi:ATP-dependent Clp protease ATP-binding subunit ClpC
VLDSLEDDFDDDDKESSKVDEDNLPLVTEMTVAAVLSEKSGIPMGQIETSELDKLKNLEVEMEHRVKGQERAVSGVARAIRRARSGLRDPKRPVASFLFCGPTGTGTCVNTSDLGSCFFLFRTIGRHKLTPCLVKRHRQDRTL